MDNLSKKSPLKLKCVPISSGAVAGAAYVFKQIELEVLEHNKYFVDDVQAEHDRLDKAIEQSIQQLNQISSQSGKEIGNIFKAHIGLLEDKVFLTEIRAILSEQKVNIEHVIASQIKSVGHKFNEIKNELIKNRFIDIQDVYHRVLRNLLEIEHVRANPLKRVEHPVILVAKKLVASDVALLDFDKILGIIIEEGSGLSHVAIIAKSLGVPAVINIPGVSSLIKTGDTLILDADEGVVLVNPDKEDITVYEKKKHAKPPKLGKLEKIDTFTKDGLKLTIESNISAVEEAKQSFIAGADGIGLLRTEFFYMTSKDMPTIEEETAFYKKIFSYNRPVTVRLLDLGADKSLPYLPIFSEENPQLGIRGIRFLLKYPDIFRNQLKSILMVNKPKLTRILLPFIAVVEDLDQSIVIIEETCKKIGVKRVGFQVGIMVEIPSVALSIRSYIEKVDFLSIGTNDLVQYTFAVSRENGSLENYRQPIHPVILHMIKNIVTVANEHRKDVVVCGEVASNPISAGILLGLGVRSFSMQHQSIQYVREQLSKMSYENTRKVAEHAMNCNTTQEILKLPYSIY
jgi:phosphotransferase system enzyme I (PtsI)